MSNLFLLCLLWINSERIVLCAIVIAMYELFLLGMLCSSLLEREFKFKRLLGVWSFIVPLGTGIIFRLKYEFFEIPNSMVRFSRDEGTALIAAIGIGIFITILINKICNTKPGIWLSLLMTCVVTFSMVGQILLLNDALPKKGMRQLSYYVSDRTINDRIFKSYLLTLEYDDNHGCTISIGKDAYKKISEEDVFEMNVYRGGLGIDYLKLEREEILKQMK